MTTARQSKKYCCSNHLRTETLVIASVEIAFSVISLLSAGIFCYAYKYQQLEKIAEDDADVRSFLRLSGEEQRMVVLISLLSSGISALLSCCLFMGARHKNKILLGLWFIVALVRFVYTVGSTLIFVYKTEHKIVYACIGLFYILYSLYALYIVKLFMKELSSVSQVQVQQMYPELDGQSIVVNDTNSPVDNEKRF